MLNYFIHADLYENENKTPSNLFSFTQIKSNGLYYTHRAKVLLQLLHEETGHDGDGQQFRRNRKYNRFEFIN